MTRQKLFLWIQALLCVLLCVMLAASAVSIFAEGMQVREAGDVTAWIFTREKVIERLTPILPVAIAAIAMTVAGLVLGIRDENQDKPVKAAVKTEKTAVRKKETAAVKNETAAAKKEKTAAGKNETAAARKVSSGTAAEGGRLTGIRAALLVLAVVLIVYGVFNGSMRDVLYKAIKICTECVGLG